MIKALRITIEGNIPYEKVEIFNYESGENLGIPDIFEDAQLAFRCKPHGTFVLPDYCVKLVQIHNRRMRAPDVSFRVKRILISDDLNYQDCYIVPTYKYAAVGAPQIFREDEQLVFICKDGLFIAPDFQVQYIHVS